MDKKNECPRQNGGLVDPQTCHEAWWTHFSISGGPVHPPINGANHKTMLQIPSYIARTAAFGLLPKTEEIWVGEN